MDHNYEAMKRIKERLIQKRKNVRNKLFQLKRGEFAHNIMLSPITKPLESIQHSIQRGEVAAAAETKQSKPLKVANAATSPPPPPKHEMSGPMLLPKVKSEPIDYLKDATVFTNADEFSADDDDNENTLQNTSTIQLNEIAPEVIDSYLEAFHPLPRHYIHKKLTAPEEHFDVKYGVRHDTDTEKFYIGNATIEIGGPDLLVKNKR